MRQDKDVVYTHRVWYTFTEENEPERAGVRFHQDFRKEEWAKEFYEYAKGSPLYTKVTMEEITNEL